MKKLIIGFSLLLSFLAIPVFAAPTTTFQPNIFPILTNTYELGTSSKQWLRMTAGEICLAGDCKTAWPTGGGTGGSNWSYINHSGIAPSTTVPVLVGSLTTSTGSTFEVKGLSPSTSTASFLSSNGTNLLTVASSTATLSTGDTDVPLNDLAVLTVGGNSKGGVLVLDDTTLGNASGIQIKSGDGNQIFTSAGLINTPALFLASLGTNTTTLTYSSLKFNANSSQPEGALSINSSGNLSTSGTLQIFGLSTQNGIVPSANNTYNLGSDSLRWQNGYFATNLIVDNGTTTSTLKFDKLIMSQTAANPLGNFYIDSSGNTSVSGTLRVFGDIFASTTNALYWDSTKEQLSIGGTDSMTVNGALLTTNLALHGSDGLTETELEIHKATSVQGAGASLYFARSRGAEGSPSVVQSQDNIFNLTAVGYDGTDYASAAQIRMTVDGTPGANDMPGRITFLTSPDGSQTLTERMRLTSDGSLIFASSTGFNLGKFFIDSSGNTFVSGTLQVFGAATAKSTLNVNGLLTMLGGASMFATNDQQFYYENSTPIDGLISIQVGVTADNGTDGYNGIDSVFSQGVPKTSGTSSLFTSQLIANPSDTGGAYNGWYLNAAAPTPATANAIFIDGAGWDKGIVINSTSTISELGGFIYIPHRLGIGALNTGGALAYIKATSTTALPLLVQDNSGITIASFASSSLSVTNSGVELNTNGLYNVVSLGSNSKAGALEILSPANGFPSAVILRKGEAITAQIDAGGTLTLSAGGTATTTLDATSLTIYQQTGFNKGKFNTDSSGNVSASGSLQIFGEPSFKWGSPSVTACDTGASITSTASNVRGYVTVGAGAVPQSCTINFSPSWSRIPSCTAMVVTTGGGISATINDISPSYVKFDFDNDMTSRDFSYQCF